MQISFFKLTLFFKRRQLKRRSCLNARHIPAGA